MKSPIINLALASLLSLSQALTAQQKKQPKPFGSHKPKQETMDGHDSIPEGLKRGNLIVNSGMEEGKGREPHGWSGIDGITAKWDSNGHPGRCLLFDTAVLQKDKKAFSEDEANFKGPGKGGLYDVVGAHEGVWAYSEPIDVTPEDRFFIIEADVMAPAKSDQICAPMVFIRGFVKVTAEMAAQGDSAWYHTYHKGGPAYSEMFGPDELYRPCKEGDYLMKYKHTLTCRISQPGKWEHFEMGFKLPEKDMKRFRPTRLLIKPYAFWPAGIYKFDNIKLRHATQQEVAAVNAKRKSINEFSNAPAPKPKK